MKENSLNIVHLHWGFPPIIGGVETHLTIILPKMAELGHKVYLLTGSVEGVDTRSDYRGAEIVRTPLMDLNWLYKRGLENLEEEIETTFSTFFDESRPDIIHAHNMHYFSKPHTRILEKLAKERNVPLILTAHNTWDDLLFMELTNKIDWAQIIAVSHFIKKEIIGIGVDDRKITVVHHGVDHNKFTPDVEPGDILDKYPQLKDRKVIFHPARIGLAKGCDVSIKAINIIKKKHPDAMLVLAGSTNIIDWGETQQKDIAYMVSLIKHFGLENDILIDTYALEDIKKLYALSKVCLYPSTSSEPFGLTMLEAMASAKPIIVTNMGGMPEIVKDSINGFVVPVRDFEMLAAKTNTLLDDERLCDRLGYTGRQMVESQYTDDRVTIDTINVYNRILMNKGVTIENRDKVTV
ncbi:MAG: glycosyltransferase family 4 protein [Candidatus Orphnella occulta]|nr:glycosyltransferase family 4 protein [Candidatus Orphnella occulta]